MANYTQKAIIQTFGEMLTEMPFEKITVSALVARCEISSNTFYYHFRDIYDLLDVWLDRQKEKYLQEMENTEDYSQCLKTILRKMQEEPQRVYHIFSSVSRERMERYVFTSVEGWFYELVKERAAGMKVDEDKIRMVASFYCYSFLGFLMKFIWERMESDVDSGVDGLSEIFQGVWEYVTQEDRKAHLP